MQYQVKDMFVAPVLDGARMGVRALYLVLTEAQTGSLQMTVSEIMTVIKEREAQHVFVTGSEPFKQDLYALVDILRNANISVQIETHGNLPKKGSLWWLNSGRRPWITWTPTTALDYLATDEALYPHISDVKIAVDEVITAEDVLKVCSLVPHGAYIVFVPGEASYDKAFDLYCETYKSLEIYPGRVRLGARLPFRKEEHEQ